MRQEAGPRQGKESGGRSKEPGPAPDTARSNGPCEARGHNDSGEEEEIVMCDEET